MMAWIKRKRVNSGSESEAASQQVASFCRICEPTCGVMATIENGRLTDIGPHHQHVSARGHFCKKARGMIDITYDSDRLLYPMKRKGAPGQFERISWEQAYTEICSRLEKSRASHGKESAALYVGNPPAFAYATVLGLDFFQSAMGIKWKYGVNSEDGGAFVAANSILFGSAGVYPKPDLWRTDFLLIEGGNPLASHGSSFSEPRVAQALQQIRQRGGRVVVVDPRKTETARSNEYIPIMAGSDAYFVLAMIHEVIKQKLIDAAFVAAHCQELERLEQATADCTPEWAESYCGIPAKTIRELARDFATAKSAAVHSRTGTCTQRYGTLSTMSLHILCLITGNMDKPGGMVFGGGIMDMSKFIGPGKIGKVRSRTTGHPETAGYLPSTSLISDIEEPGAGQVKSLIMVGANPAIASPACGGRLDSALQKLDLFVAIDLYMNESNRFADYLLPSAAMFEREDVPLISMGTALRPSLYATRALIAPRGESKEDYDILDEICRRLGLGGAVPGKFLQSLARLGIRIKPRHFMDHIVRTSKVGDKYGLKPSGVSITKLQNLPDGVVVDEHLPTGVFAEVLQTEDGKVSLFPEELASEIERLKQDDYYAQAEYPLRLIGQREKLTHNTWMHNSTALAGAKKQHCVRIHPDDAHRYGIEDGDTVVIRSANGEVSSKALVTDTMHRGNVALPHGWGQNGGWQRANRAGGVNSNILASDNPQDTEAIAAMSVLNGIPVQLQKPVVAEKPHITQ